MERPQIQMNHLYSNTEHLVRSILFIGPISRLYQILYDQPMIQAQHTEEAIKVLRLKIINKKLFSKWFWK